MKDIQLIDLDEDTGKLEIRFGQDDSFSVGGYGHEVTLRLPLYGHEAAEILNVLKPLAERG